jgi:4'-phosphopantetheinyl transferase
MLLIACIEISRTGGETIVADFATEDDRRLAGRHRSPSRRAQSLTARALLRAVLEKGTGQAGRSWRLTQDANGKPVIAPEDGQTGFEVSISHSRSVAACAVTDLGPIGIDVEYCARRSRLEAMSAAAFGERERESIKTTGPAGFYRIWTLREALAKASGEGLSFGGSSGDLFADIPEEGTWRRRIGERDWLFSCRGWLGGYALASALAPLSAGADRAMVELAAAMQQLG